MLLASITSSVTSFIGDHGVLAVFLLMLLDAVFPAASELVMVYAGALAAGAVAGSVSLFGERIDDPAWGFVTMALTGTIGYVIGSLAGWVIGAWGGRPLLLRHGRWFHLSPATLDRAEHWFERHGGWAVFLGRLTPVVRSFTSIPAGVFRDPLPRYTLLTLAGSAIWCFAIAGAGYGLGESYERFDRNFRYADYVVLGVVVALAALVAGRWLRSRSARRAARAAR